MKMSKSRLSFRLFGITTLLIVTIVFALFQGGFVSWFLFYCYLPFALYSILLYLYPVKLVETIRREMNQTTFKAGEKLVGTITLTRKLPIPFPFLVIEEMLPSSLQKCHQAKHAKVMLFPWFKRKITFQYVISQIPRGEHIFSNIRIRRGDLLGLIEKETIFTIQEKFLVFPKIVPIDYRQLNNQFNQGMTTANVKMQRDTTIAASVREYIPGDRFTWIDWKATARKNAIMTKEFEQQQSQDVLIFMDRLQSEWFEQVVSFSASLSRAILRRGAKVGFISIGAERSIFPVVDNGEHNQTIYYHLAKVQDNANTSFSSIIEYEKKKHQNNLTYLLVTSTLTPDLVQTIEKLSFQNTNIMVFIVKEEVSQLSLQEKKAIDLLRRRNIFVHNVGKEQFSNAFVGVERLL